MDKYFEDLDLWWHPGLNISLSLVPLIGLGVIYSYFLLGLTLLVAWGEDMKASIDLIVRPYKDVIPIVYTSSVGACKRQDSKVISADFY